MSIKSKQHNIITLIAGGTGGHIYPALAILYEIKKTDIMFQTQKPNTKPFKNTHINNKK